MKALKKKFIIFKKRMSVFVSANVAANFNETEEQRAARLYLRRASKRKISVVIKLEDGTILSNTCGKLNFPS